MRKPSWSRKKSERGFSLIMMSAAAVVMFGMLGLTTDLGRVFICAPIEWNSGGINGRGCGGGEWPLWAHRNLQWLALRLANGCHANGHLFDYLRRHVLSFQFTECRCDLQICSGCGVGGRASLFPAHLAGRGHYPYGEGGCDSRPVPKELGRRRWVQWSGSLLSGRPQPSRC